MKSFLFISFLIAFVSCKGPSVTAPLLAKAAAAKKITVYNTIEMRDSATNKILSSRIEKTTRDLASTATYLSITTEIRVGKPKVIEVTKPCPQCPPLPLVDFTTISVGATAMQGNKKVATSTASVKRTEKGNIELILNVPVPEPCPTCPPEKVCPECIEKVCPDSTVVRERFTVGDTIINTRMDEKGKIVLGIDTLRVTGSKGNTVTGKILKK